MTSTEKSLPTPSDVIRILAKNVKLWMVPAAVVTVLAVAYAVFRPDTWEATQAVIVRNEASNNAMGPGKFGQPEEMKAVQDTIMELAYSGGVLRAALAEVGPPANYKKDPAEWPTLRDIEDTREELKITPPKGAEFGKTEVFYVSIRDKNRDRALDLNRAICSQLQTRYQKVRDSKAQSMIDELSKTVDLAKNDLTEATGRLSKVEKGVGADLAELRMLHDTSAGDGALRRTATEIRNELRKVSDDQQTNRRLLSLLEEAQEDPGQLLAAPNRLLESQPALRRLKEGLVDAELKTASIKGTMAAEHPLVKAAVAAEEEVGRHLHEELAIARRGVKADLSVNADREAKLREQLAEVNDRLARLAEVRATYSNLVAENQNRMNLVEQAEQNLAEARATHASAKATSLISRIDNPETGSKPVGPSRAVIVLVGMVGGLLVGFGVVFLTVQPAQPTQPAYDMLGSVVVGNVMVGNTESTSKAVSSQVSTISSNGSLSFKEALKKIHFASHV